VLENFGNDAYRKVCDAIFPLIEKLLYDKTEEIRDRAIQIVAEIRNVVNEDEKEHVMRLTLGLAHDDNEKLRESAVKLLNELAPDMGQQLCECYIVKEIRSLGMDDSSNVRITVVQNLLNVSKNVSIDCFSK
jgi:HEAT repeat protein